MDGALVVVVDPLSVIFPGEFVDVDVVVVVVVVVIDPLLVLFPGGLVLVVVVLGQLIRNPSDVSVPLF